VHAPTHAPALPDREARARRIYGLVLGLILIGSLGALAWPRFFGREIGEACDSNWICKSKKCVWPHGYCTQLCAGDDSQCPAGFHCRPAKSDVQIGRDYKTSMSFTACRR
jgi:hypothetical protein